MHSVAHNKSPVRHNVWDYECELYYFLAEVCLKKRVHKETVELGGSNPSVLCRILSWKGLSGVVKTVLPYCVVPQWFCLFKGF